MYLLAICAWIAYVVWNAMKVSQTLKKKDPEVEEVLKTMKWGKMAVALVIALFAAVLTKSVMVVPAGYRVVVFDISRGVLPVPLGEGLRVVVPVLQTAIKMEVRVQKTTFDASAASKDMQVVATKVTLNYQPVIETIPRLYQNVGLGYVEKVIHPAVQEVVKAVTAKHTAEALITQREVIKNEIHQGLDKVMRQFGLMLVETYITDFDFSENFNKAIEQKQVAEQDALKAKRVLEQVKTEAEQKIASARAEAESLRMQNQVVTPMILKLRAIEMQTKAVEKWNGVMPSVMLGNGSMPMIDLSKIGSSVPSKSEE